MSGSASGILGGTPSTTTPIAGPWLSPQVVKRNKVPKLLLAIGTDRRVHIVDEIGKLLSFIDCDHPDIMIAAIDMENFAGNTRAEIAEQIKGRMADFQCC